MVGHQAKTNLQRSFVDEALNGGSPAQFAENRVRNNRLRYAGTLLAATCSFGNVGYAIATNVNADSKNISGIQQQDIWKPAGVANSDWREGITSQVNQAMDTKLPSGHVDSPVSPTLLPDFAL